MEVENRIIKVVPSSPPTEDRISDNGSPEIRVTDTPETTGISSPPPTPKSSMSSASSSGGSPLNSVPVGPYSPMTTSSPMSSPPNLSHLLLPSTFFHAAAMSAINHQQQINLQRAKLAFSIENILKPSFGSAPSLVLPESPKSPPAPPPPATTPMKKRENNNHPVDLTAKPSVEASSPKVSSEKKPAGAGNEGKKDDDVPPGMVRGPNGQLWPAWVFCTRYSDRPSSGKSLFFWYFSVKKKKRFFFIAGNRGKR